MRWVNAHIVQTLVLTALVEVLSLVTSVAVATERPLATFDEWAKVQARRGDLPAEQVQDIGIAVRVVVSREPTDDQARALEDHLRSADTYEFRSGWPGSENEVDTSTERWQDNHPFVLTRVQEVSALAPPTVRTSTVILIGQGSARARGHILVTPLEGWDIRIEKEKETVRFSAHRLDELPPFRGNVRPAYGDGGFTLDVTASGVLRQRANGIETLSLGGKIPLGKPDDVEGTPGAARDASREVADVLSLSWNRITYSGGGLKRMGIRARATGCLEGFEGVWYWQPVMGWFDEMHGFYGTELEAGYREGDAEWANLTTRAPGRGNIVARLGTVVEWAPVIGGVNRDLSRGLRLFVRGRGWADVYDDDNGDRSVRFRQFLDAELFFNFSSQYRVFLRWEDGYLPPDLTGRSDRVYVGVGGAF